MVSQSHSHLIIFLDTTKSFSYLATCCDSWRTFSKSDYHSQSISFPVFTTPRSARSRRHRTDSSFSVSDDRPCRWRLPIRRPYRITRARMVCGFAVADSAAVAWQPLSAPDLGTDPEASADGGVGYLEKRGCADWVQPLSTDRWPIDSPPSMAGCGPPINCPIDETTRRRIVATFRISWISLRIAGAGNAGGVTILRADGVLVVVALVNLAICNRTEKELHFLWRKYSWAKSQSIICDNLL